jgi:phytoene dehydrogenase-like protein
VTQVDAIVVGSGPNGLVAANLLMDAGWSVVVLEGQEAPGGSVRTAEVTAPGFYNDLCSSFFPLAVSRSPIASLGLADVGLRWLRSPTVLTHLPPTGPPVTLSTDLAATEASLEASGSGDGQRWRQLVRDWTAVERELLRTLFTPFPPLRPAIRLARTTGIGDTLRLARRFLLPAGRLGRELFAGDGGRLLLGGLAMHADVPLDSTASGGYGFLLAMLAQHYGFPVPEGGAGSLTQALVTRLRRGGGELVCRAPVARIDIRYGVAHGVRTVDGTTWTARRGVLADVPAPALYQQLLPASAVPSRVLDDLANFQYDPSTVKLDWALSGRIPWRSPEAAGSGTLHIGADSGGLARYATALNSGRIPDELFLICGQMTTADASRSPAGTEAFWAYTHLPHRRNWSGDEIAAVAGRMEQVLEDCAPGFSSLVLARRVAGPGVFEEENPSLVGGALSGGTNAVHQQLFFRPIPGLGRADTPVDRLYLASASAHPGGGVHGGPGANAARAALARDRTLSGRLYRSTVQGIQRRIYSSGGD